MLHLHLHHICKYMCFHAITTLMWVSVQQKYTMSHMCSMLSCIKSTLCLVPGIKNQFDQNDLEIWACSHGKLSCLNAELLRSMVLGTASGLVSQTVHLTKLSGSLHSEPSVWDWCDQVVSGLFKTGVSGLHWRSMTLWCRAYPEALVL